MGLVLRIPQTTRLERAVLEKICRQYPEQRAILEAQAASLTVLDRENTKAGFFTDFDVDRSKAPVRGCGTIIGKVWAEIDGFEGGMTFLAYLEDGYLSCLEGASMGDNTEDLDLEALTFRIFEI